MKYNEVISILANNVAKYFDNVYHSAEIIYTGDLKQPAVVNGDEWTSLVPTDQREVVYIRRNGNDEMMEVTKPGSCSIGYKMRSPLRIVYCNDFEKNPDKIISLLMKSAMVANSRLSSIIRDKWKLLKEESSGDYHLGATTAYFAIDIYVMWDLLPDTCEEDFCISLENPLCK